MSRLTLPRFINPASIKKGDRIRVVWKVGDIEHSRQAKVGEILHQGFRRSVQSVGGQEIFSWTPRTDGQIRVTLLAEGEPEKPDALFDFAPDEHGELVTRYKP